MKLTFDCWVNNSKQIFSKFVLITQIKSSKIGLMYTRIYSDTTGEAGYPRGFCLFSCTLIELQIQQLL